jgi:H/ACA ribonucleoprotein complex subunit 4
MKDNWLVKEECETSDKYGKSPKARTIEEHLRNGLVILDKPAGPTSHQVASWAKDIFHAKKCGHSGTLDPNVTGVLPLQLDNTAKIIPALVRGEKEYISWMKLHEDVDEELVRIKSKEFVGKITQLPPVKSGVKRQLRQRTIYELEILEINGRNILFRAKTEAGTYIRTLCVDWGKALNVGAHMHELRRTKASGFDISESFTLHDLKDAYEFWKEDGNEEFLRKIVRPVEDGVRHLQKIIVKDSAVGAVAHGAPLHVNGVCSLTDKIQPDQLIAIMSLKGELVALAKAQLDSQSIFHKRAGEVAIVERVIVDQHAYPRMWKKSE